MGTDSNQEGRDSQEGFSVGDLQLIFNHAAHQPLVPMGISPALHSKHTLWSGRHLLAGMENWPTVTIGCQVHTEALFAFPLSLVQCLSISSVSAGYFHENPAFQAQQAFQMQRESREYLQGIFFLLPKQARWGLHGI